MSSAPIAVTVVTGAASGIGEAIAARLAAEGHVVIAVDRDAARLSEVAERLAGEVEVVVGDVAERSTHEAALAAATRAGGLTGWVNCAGLTLRFPLHDLADADCRDEAGDLARRVIDANLVGTLLGTATALGDWLVRGVRGAIVSISSVHGRQAAPDHAVYEMTKAAIEALTRNVAVSYAAHGIRCNAVAPGAVRTPALVASLESAPDPAAAEADLLSAIPAARLAEPGEIANVTALLLSPELDYVTGQTIVVDGGMTIPLGVPVSERSARSR